MRLTKTGFHPIISQWFLETFESPTDVQTKAWSEIASGKHLLITAPTGSGKTLAAFLWAIHQLVSNEWPPGRTRVVYISPLKALNNDVQRNLIKPLGQLQARFQAQGDKARQRIHPWRKEKRMPAIYWGSGSHSTVLSRKEVFCLFSAKPRKQSRHFIH